MILNRRTPSRQKAGMEFLFSILLFLVFLLCSVFTILIGSRVYENIRARDNNTFHTDTALAYVTNKVRQADRADAVTVREIEGQQVLVLISDIAESQYETWIYTMDGQLKELFSEEGSGLGLAAGLNIMECPSIRFSMDESPSGGHILSAALDGAETARLFLRSDWKEGAGQ